MAQSLRSEVLKAFKSLHKASRHVFEGDSKAINKARAQINEEYKKYKNVTNQQAIEELLSHSKAVESELLQTVIQARQTESGQYEVRLRDEIVKLDNVPFKECPS